MKIAVIHPGKQHSFQLATALHKRGLLWKYITSVYDRSFSLTSILLKFSKGDLKKKISSRKCAFIPNDKVLQYNELFVIITLFLNRLPFFHKFAERWNYLVESSFYKKTMGYIRHSQPDAVVYYNGYANKHLELLKDKKVIKFMDVSIGHRLYLQKILDNEIEATGLVQIKSEHFSYWDEKMIASDLKGCAETDFFLVPSEFVKKSLVENGIPLNKIVKVPYGVNVQQFAPKSDNVIGPNEKLKLLYVGSISYRKGIHRLLNVVRKYPNIEMYLAGGYSQDSKIYLQYKDYANIHFLGFVTRDRLNQVYNDCHVFVLPSFCEGMAMVGLEAMSAGLPIICTTNTGVNDVVINGENGFVYSPEDESSLESHILWFDKNRSKLLEMSKNARKTSLSYSWEKYHENVANAIIDCVKK